MGEEFQYPQGLLSTGEGRNGETQHNTSLFDEQGHISDGCRAGARQTIALWQVFWRRSRMGNSLTWTFNKSVAVGHSNG